MYQHSSIPVRPEVVAAHERRLRALARPGTWLPAGRRLEIAREARAADTCRLCNERRNVVSPSLVDGEHGRATAAPAAAVDASHRIVADPHRLSETWLKGLLGDGLDAAEYVELVGVVVTVVALDTFSRAIGVEASPLPAAEPGDPPGVLPDGLTTETAWLPTVQAGAATGELAAFYERFEIGNIVVALSMVPAEELGFWDLVDAMYVPLPSFVDLSYGRALSRVQMEILASQVSMLNQCFYCSSVHVMLLDAARRQAGIDVGTAALAGRTPADEAGLHSTELVGFARAVHGGSRRDIEAARDRLRAVAGPAAVGEAAAVVGLFMAINRVADATGTRVDEHVAAATTELRAALGIDAFPVDGAD